MSLRIARNNIEHALAARLGLGSIQKNQYPPVDAATTTLLSKGREGKGSIK